MAVTINVVGNYDDRELAKAQASLAKLGTVSGKTSSAYTSNTSKMKASTIALGTAMGGFAVMGISKLASATTRWVTDSIAAASEYETLQRQTAAVIKSTGNAANVSAKFIMQNADALESLSTISAEEIQQGQNLLLTFTNIRNEAGKGNDIFNQTTLAATNLASAMGTSMKSASLQLGKALNNPATGLTALTRSGVSFTEQQKKQIARMVENGKTMKAQKTILAELEVQFGGAAKAAGGGYAGAIYRAKDAVGDLGRDLARQALPSLTKMATWVADKAVPAVTKFIAQVKPKLIPALQQAWAVLKRVAQVIASSVLPVLKQVGTFVADNASLLTKLAVAITAGVVAWKVYSATVNTVRAVTAAYRAQKQALIMLSYNERVIQLQNTAAKVKDIAVMAAHKAAALAQAAVSKAVAAAQWLVNAAMTANPIGLVVAAIVGLVAALVVLWKKNEGFRRVVLAVWDAIKKAFKVALDAIVGYFKTWWKGVQLVWAVVKAVFKAGVAVVTAYVRTWLAVLRAVWQGVTSAFSAGVATVKRVFGAIVGFFRGVWDRVVSLFTEMPGKLLRLAEDTISGFIEGIRNKAGDIIEAIKTYVTDAVPDWVKKVFGIASPAKAMIPLGENIVLGLAKGIKDKGQKLEEAMREVMGRLRDAAAAGLGQVQATAKKALELARSTATSIVEFGGVSQAQLPETGGSAEQLVAEMRARVSAAKAFGGNLRKLQKLGLNASSLREVLAAGPTAGNAIAEALLQGGVGAIRQVNSLERQLKQTAAATGSWAADERYGMTSRDARGVMATKVEFKEGSVVVNVGAGADRESARMVERAVEQAMRKVMREMRASRRG